MNQSNQAVKPQPRPQDAQPTQVLAKKVQLGLGVDLLGSQLSLSNHRGNVLEVTPLGVRAVSKKNGRVILIPWANIKACELV